MSSAIDKTTTADDALDGSELGMATPLQASSDTTKSNFDFSALLGPGLLVCLADTDAACLLVACQSGAQWGYSLLLLQLMLIPVLFLAQELTVRLGVCTKQGYVACIQEMFGAFWARLACSLLVISCIGAIVTEMSGIAAVCHLLGAERTLGAITAVAVIVAIVLFFNYRQVECIGIFFGLFELTFVATMFILRPSVGEVVSGAFSFHMRGDYIMLIAANIGAVIMPWMLVFQQTAVVNRRLTTQEELQGERANTLLGSVLTQLIMVAALVSMAAVRSQISGDLDSIIRIRDALSPTLGSQLATALLSLAFGGGSLCAAFVVALAAAWAACEACGGQAERFALDQSPREAPRFYGTFLLTVVAGAAVLLAGVDLLKLNVAMMLLNAFLAPMMLYFLFTLATGPLLPGSMRVGGLHKGILIILFVACSVASTVSLVSGAVMDNMYRS